jgi:hypothetical protein
MASRSPRKSTSGAPSSQSTLSTLSPRSAGWCLGKPNAPAQPGGAHAQCNEERARRCRGVTPLPRGSTASPPSTHREPTREGLARPPTSESEPPSFRPMPASADRSIPRDGTHINCHELRSTSGSPRLRSRAASNARRRPVGSARSPRDGSRSSVSPRVGCRHRRVERRPAPGIALRSDAPGIATRWRARGSCRSRRRTRSIRHRRR